MPEQQGINSACHNGSDGSHIDSSRSLPLSPSAAAAAGKPWSALTLSLASAIHQSWSWAWSCSLMSTSFSMTEPSQTAQPDGAPQTLHVDLDSPLQRLKTLAEVQASEATIDVYIAEVHPKATKVACDAMRPLLPDDHKKINLAHLRRPCTYAQLPEHLQAELCPPGWFDAIIPKSRRKKGGNKSSFILLCATCLVEEQKLLDAIVEAFKEPEYEAPTRIHRIPVPLFPPTSNEQAEKWSRMFWPTSFKNNNPYGPHPAAIAKAEWELINTDTLCAEVCMKLARAVAADSVEQALGQPIGVVVVERLPGMPPRIVAVASDGRYRGYEACEADRAHGGRGNVTAHAVMRAIGLVAQKRRIIDGKTDVMSGAKAVALAESSSAELQTNTTVISNTSTAPIDEVVSCVAQLPKSPGPSDLYLDVPITDRESRYFDPPTLSPRGYLCLNLELYTTHEPCIMCSMAILHSRFGRVVFEKPMRVTGAMMAQRLDSAPALKHFEPTLPMERLLPPTKSAKRRKSRKNSKLRAIQASIDPQARLPPLEYGLWWRAQLNWKFLCWQWRQDRVGTKLATKMLPIQDSVQSLDAASCLSNSSRRSSSCNSLPSAEQISIEDLADLVKSLTVADIPDSVHI